jgi:hypothetical protein
MSYSFSAKGATKHHALADAHQKFDEMVASQPVHKVDREAAFANLQKHMDLLPEAGTDEEVIVSMHGSVGGDMDWSTGEVRRLSTAGSGCSVSVCRKPTA